MPIFEWTEETPIDEAIFQSLGAASACWENLENAGIFDSTRAKEIGDNLLEFIRKTDTSKLGLATTQELLLELKARAEISIINNKYPESKESLKTLKNWTKYSLIDLPRKALDYRTVGGI